MIRNAITHILNAIHEFYVSRFLFDQARPVEVLSLFAMAGWAIFLFSDPEILARDSYSGFSALNAFEWAWLMSGVALVQLMAIFKPVGQLWHELRFAAMAFSGGIWTVIAANFWLSGVSTTANITYTSLALVSALTGIFLGWKTQNY